MPYDLHVTEQDHDALHTEWEFAGTFTKLWHARVMCERAGQQRPELRRWLLFYSRRTTAALATLHSMGEYPHKEDPHDL